MENVTYFLESSTIHGLAHIATGRRHARLFWILVVIAGFTGAGVMICNSFQSWTESPVKTTIETHPITEITFPKVTICPPKNTYTDLNYDLLMTDNMTMNNDTRNELASYALDLLHQPLNDAPRNNMSKELDEKYFYWYKGYTNISQPSYHSNGTITVSKENLIETIATWGPEFYLYLNFFVHSFNPKPDGYYGEVLRITNTNNNYGNFGDRIPAIFTNGKGNILVKSQISDNFDWTSQDISIKNGTWYDLEIEQLAYNNKVTKLPTLMVYTVNVVLIQYFFQIKLNGRVLVKIENNIVHEYKNVKVLASWGLANNPADVTIKNLIYMNRGI